jgi:hypothetical protein
MVLLPGNDCVYLFHCSGFQLSCHIILAALSKTRSAFKYRLHLLEFWNSGLHHYKTGSNTEPPCSVAGNGIIHLIFCLYML